MDPQADLGLAADGLELVANGPKWLNLSQALLEWLGQAMAFRRKPTTRRNWAPSGTESSLLPLVEFALRRSQQVLR